MKLIAHLSIDLGASSGRAMIGVLSGEPQWLQLAEVHRFEHHSCPTPTGPVWDLTGIWQNILTGLRAAAVWCKANQAELRSVGVDTWGVDWALVGKSGELLALPHCYRDPQNDAACERVLERIGGFEKLYARTGIQLMSLNTLFQVAARHEREPRLFDVAERLLFLPDLFHYWLSGELSTERTIASTSSMLDVHTCQWDGELMNQLRLPTHILGPITEPGTNIGCVRAELAAATGVPKSLRVILPPSHDTASAVAAVPAVGDRSWAYLSSGTWSLLGAEIAKPIATDEARQVPFTNERGIDGTVRFLKNIAGLWLVQELRREWDLQGERRDYSELIREAEQAEPHRTLIDPNHAEFVSPGNMAEKIRQFARDTNQPVPETVGQLIRCCLESLANCYRQTTDQLEAVLGRPIEVLHLVGGGTQNHLLNRLTAEALGRPVICGPVEATAIGNVLVQALGCGEIADRAELRTIVARSFDCEELNSGQQSDHRISRSVQLSH
ncbi:MAG: rhamnulokinase family protein [Bythopirellula sp.]|nr:rhamnulokinase family protein [Bythopirellula sp.]